MKATFRFPGPVEYSYAEVETTPGSPGDNKRELRDIDAELLTLVGNTLASGSSLVALGPLQGRVIENAPVPQPQDAAQTPAWAQTGPQAPQEAQGYAYPPQGVQAPQGAVQGFPQAPQAQGYVPAQQYAQQAAPVQAGPPPGQQAPVCAHNVPKKYHPAGQNKAGKDYSASWRCQANVPQNQQCGVDWLK